MNNDQITMVAVPNTDGAARFIPSDRAETLIDMDWLTKHAACQPGKEWFAETFPDGCKYVELRAKLAEEKQDNWETWILVKIGGDTATAGDRGTATAGDRGTATAGDGGTATAGDSGTATAGDSGTATAGDSGTATAGDRGTATAGDSGTATAGYRGTATAGLEGVILIKEWDAKQCRYRVVVGVIGENDIEANTPYIVVEGKLVKKPAESEA